MLSLILALILSYLAGSIPTAIIASRIVMKDDIRNHGSGNAGATNVFRVMGWKPALIVVLVDVGKGVAAVILIARIGWGANLIDPFILQIIAGLAAIAGHVWTVFAGFRGGKGMGTAFGVLVSLAPVASLITLAIWIVLVVTVKIVSVGSLCAAVVFPGILFLQKFTWDPELHVALLYLGMALAALVFVTHRSNIKRLLKGEEHRFGRGKKEETR